MPVPVVYIPGDGIGPSIVGATVRILDAAGAEIEWVRAEAGLGAFEAGGDPLPEVTVEAIRQHKLALKGPLTTPVGTGFRSVNVALRREFDLYVNLRPVRSFEGVQSRYSDIDLVIFRENTEGLYSVMERSIPFDTGQNLFRKGFWNDFALYTILQSYVLAWVIFGIANIIDKQWGFSARGALSGWPVAAQVGLSLIVHDFYIFWFHRLQHRNRFLWRIHEAHHSTTDVDWLSGSRSHSLEILINQSVEYIPLVLLGCQPETIAIKGIIDAGWGMYIHSNIDVHSGWLQYMINGPEMHRWHHAVDGDAHNVNFGTKFAFWDWIFGTAFFPRNRKPAGYGLNADDFPSNYLLQHTYAFRPFESKDT